MEGSHVWIYAALPTQCGCHFDVGSCGQTQLTWLLTVPVENVVNTTGICFTTPSPFQTSCALQEKPTFLEITVFTGNYSFGPLMLCNKLLGRSVWPPGQKDTGKKNRKLHTNYTLWGRNIKVSSVGCFITSAMEGISSLQNNLKMTEKIQ